MAQGAGVRNEAEWILRRRFPAALLHACAIEGLDPIVIRVLCARRMDTPDKIRAFLAPEQHPLGDPLEMADMQAAVERIRRAILAQERICVYGDFDVDGVTSVALLVSVLRELGAQAEPHIPDRFSEGYGLNNDSLDALRDSGFTLCVAVDCGVRSVDEVRRAQERGLDMVIADHHSVPDELPPAVAVVDPKRDDSAYAFEDLAGVGVTSQLCRALCAAMQDTGAGARAAAGLDDYLDLVALGTVADIVPLEGENRTLAARGLARLRQTARPGLLALMAQAGVQPGKANSIDIAFRLAPRLNASGRLEHAQMSYDLLMARTQEQACEIAEALGRTNDERQRLLKEQLEVAGAQVAEEPLPLILIIAGPDYHEGIVGLIASRLREIHYRPTLVLRENEQTALARGSARSIEGLHITRALESCKELFEHYGGHEQAAGFTVRTENLSALRERLLAYAEAHLDEEKLTPRLLVDAIVPLSALTPETVVALGALEPFGKGNPEPTLAALDVELVDIRAIGQENKHLRLYVRQGNASLPCIAFRQGELADEYPKGSRIDLVFRPSLNEWQGNTTLQLVVEAIRPHSAEQPGD